MEPILGPILGPDRPKRGQDEPKRTIKSFKEPKNSIFKKVVLALDIRRFFALRASQKSVKRPKKAPKRHPKNSKTPKKRDPKLDPKMIKFWTNFGAILGTKTRGKKKTKMDPKMRSPFFYYIFF